MSETTSPDKHLSRLFCAPAVPLYYLVIPKCGCTFVKNFIWQLNEGRTYPEPERIHDVDHLMPRADAFEPDTAAISGSETAFVVLRNPLDRFFSLYSDKVIGEGHRNYVPLRRTLIEGYGLISEPQSVEDHRHNIDIMARWIESNLKDGNELEPEAHWTPQAFRSNIMKVFDLRVLTTNKLTQQLGIMLANRVPDLADKLQDVPRYASSKPFQRDEVMTQEVRSLVNQIYREDRRLFEAARDLWKERAPSGPADIPRYSEL